MNAIPFFDLTIFIYFFLIAVLGILIFLQKYVPGCLWDLRFTKTHFCSSHVRTVWLVWVLANRGVSEGQASWK